MLSETKEKIGLSDYLYVLFKWKRFIIINLFIVSLIAVIIALLIPNQYKAVATITIPSDSQSGLSGLGNLSGFIGGKSSIASMGAKLLGFGSSTSEDMLLGIVNSRSTLKNIIEKFNLVDYYNISDNNIDKTIKSFRNDISAELNEFELIEISIINEDPAVSAVMANYVVDYIDSVNARLNVEQARNNRMFIEKRYFQNITDLKRAEDSLYAFQSKYGIVAVPEQLEVTVKAAAEIETELFRKEMEAYFISQIYGNDSPQYQNIIGGVDLLKKKVQEIKNSSNLDKNSNILFAFQKMPEMAIEYLRVFREVEIQQSILEFVMPMYEQAKVEEQKSMPTIMIIDSAVPPQEKYSPKRAVIVLGIFFLFLFIAIPFVFVAEKSFHRVNYDNPLQMKTSDIVKKIVKFYRIRF